MNEWQKKAQKKEKSQAQKIEFSLSLSLGEFGNASDDYVKLSERINFCDFFICWFVIFLVSHCFFLCFIAFFAVFSNRIKGFFERAGKAKLKNGFRIVSV